MPNNSTLYTKYGMNSPLMIQEEGITPSSLENNRNTLFSATLNEHCTYLAASVFLFLKITRCQALSYAL